MEHLTSIDEQAEDYSLCGQKFHSKSAAQSHKKKLDFRVVHTKINTPNKKENDIETYFSYLLHEISDKYSIPQWNKNIRNIQIIKEQKLEIRPFPSQEILNNELI